MFSLQVRSKNKRLYSIDTDSFFNDAWRNKYDNGVLILQEFRHNIEESAKLINEERKTP